MKRFIALLTLIVLLMITLAVSTPSIMAQDATLESAPVSVVTQEAAPPAVVCEDGAICNVNEAPETPAEPVDNSPLAWIAIGLSALTAIMVGFSLFLQRVGNRAEAVSNDPSAVSLLERGYDTMLPDIVKSIVQPLKESLERSDQAVDKLLTLLNKITDGVPELSKPVTPPAPPASNTTSQDSM